MGVNPQAQRAQRLRGEPFRQASTVRQPWRAAAQQPVNIGLVMILMRSHQGFFLTPAVQRLFEARELERFDQIVHHPVMHGGLNSRGIGSRGDHDDIGVTAGCPDNR
ncbi:hypothetical protein D3C76_1344660 [compost metagenome]